VVGADRRRFALLVGSEGVESERIPLG